MPVNLIDFVPRAIAIAVSVSVEGGSRLSSAVLGLEGMSSAKVRGLLNGCVGGQERGIWRWGFGRGRR